MSKEDSPRAVFGLAKLPVELQDVIYAHLQAEGKFKTLANLNICSKVLNEVTRRHLYKEVHWKVKDCKAQRALFAETGKAFAGWEHIQYLFIHSGPAIIEWYGLLGDFRKSLQQPYSVESDHMCHTWFPKIVFLAQPERDFPVRREYFLETTTTVWTFNVSARNATFEDPELINTMLRAVYEKGEPRVELTRHLKKVHGLPYLQFNTPPIRPRKKQADEEDSERWSTDDDKSETGKGGDAESDEQESVESKPSQEGSDSASGSPQLVSSLVESEDGWIDEDDEDYASEEDDQHSYLDDMPGFYNPALALDLQLDIPQAEIIVVRFFTAEGRYPDSALASDCAYRMFLAATDLCRDAIEMIEEEFTLTVGICDLASIKSWINTVATASSARSQLSGKTMNLTELVFDLDVGFGPDDFLSWIYRIQEKLLSEFPSDQGISGLPSKICFDTARGAPIPFDATSCLRAVIDLSSVKKARYVRSGMKLRNCVDLLGAVLQLDGKEVVGKEKAKAEKMLGAKLVM